MIHKKRNNPVEVPAFSNQDGYKYIYGKKPSSGPWRKVKRLFYRNDTWADSKAWVVAGGLSLFLIVVPFLLALGSTGKLHHNLFALQLGAASFFYLFVLSKSNREGNFFKVSGIFGILLAVLLPILILNLYPLHTAALFLPAHLSICGIAALYRSDENLEPVYIFYKALSYFVFTLFTGWLCLYALSNI